MASRFRKILNLEPGSRLVHRGRESNPNPALLGFSTSARKLPGSFALTAIVKDRKIIFKDIDGSLVSESTVDAAKKQHWAAIRTLMQSKCDELNAPWRVLGELHLLTPAPNVAFHYRPQPYPVPKPQPPVATALTFLDKLNRNKLKRIEAENTYAQFSHEKAVHDWQADRTVHNENELEKSALVSKAISGNADAMEALLYLVLMDIVWPQPISMSFEVQQINRQLALDVELPKIEDIPTTVVSIPDRGYTLRFSDMGEADLRQLYLLHIHSLSFRLVGEVFATLPTIQEVIISGYSSHESSSDPIENIYLFSATVSREKWQEINFRNILLIDVVEAFNRFEVRRNMTTYMSKPIQPF
jgi:hypothetical protein